MLYVSLKAMRAAPLKAFGRYARRGFTLIELMIALSLACSCWCAAHDRAGQQTGIRQPEPARAVQDNERMAMTMITDVVQSAGYFSQSPPEHLDTDVPTARCVRVRTGDHRHLFGRGARRFDLGALLPIPRPCPAMRISSTAAAPANQRRPALMVNTF